MLPTIGMKLSVWNMIARSSPLGLIIYRIQCLSGCNKSDGSVIDSPYPFDEEEMKRFKAPQK